MRWHGVAWIIFQWALLSLTAYRLQRIVTTDSWPISRWFRMSIYRRFGGDSAWYDFFTCGWCFGWYCTLAVFAISTLWLNVPLPVLQALAATAVVGQIAQRD